MKNRLTLSLVLVVTVLAAALPSYATDVAVVVDKSNSSGNVSSVDLSKILQASGKMWPSGKKPIIVLRELPAPETELALQKLLKLSAAEVKDFVNSHKHLFLTAASDQAVLKIVEATPGAVGLVDVYSITSRVNVLRVDGKLPLEQGYLLH